MQAWNPSQSYSKVVEANRRYYKETASQYNATETCVTDSHFQDELTHDLDTILAMMSHIPLQKLRVLDACGGSGNVSLKLLQKGINPTICDISQELLAIFAEKTKGIKARPTIHCGEIGDFLSKHPNEFDLIIFSSALHHFQDVEAVIQQALTSLAKGGMLFTIFDPTIRTDRFTRGLLLADYTCFKLFDQPKDFLPAIGRSSRRQLTQLFPSQGRTVDAITEITTDKLGVLAEFHARKGIDDQTLVANLQNRAEVVWHIRYPSARFQIFRALLRFVQKPTNFKLLLRKIDL